MSPRATLAATRHAVLPWPGPCGQDRAEIMAADTHIAWLVVNVNQAARRLNATGSAPERLGPPVLLLISRAVDPPDSTAADLARGLR